MSLLNIFCVNLIFKNSSFASLNGKLSLLMLVRVIVNVTGSFSSIVLSLSMLVQKYESENSWSRFTSSLISVDLTDLTDF